MPDAPEPADLVIEGRIASLHGERGWGWVEALAVRAGRVVAVGSIGAVRELAGPSTVRWRLPTPQLVTPSITDAHLHLVSAALAAGQPDLTGLDRAGLGAAIAEAHRTRLERGDEDGWLLGHGWSLEALGEHPDASWLDEAAPGRPVALWAHDHHSRWLSARAVQMAGLAAVADPPAGRIERDAEGRPTGLLYEAAAGLVDAVLSAPAASDVDWALGAYARTLAELGITSVHDPGDMAPDPGLRGGPTLYRELARGGRLPLRITASVREDALDRAIELGFASGRPVEGDEAGRYHDGWLKLFADGSLGSRTASMLQAYEADDPAGPPPCGPLGLEARSRERLTELAARAAAAGIASQIHAIGDAAVRAVLDALAGVPGVGGARHRVEHAQLIHPDDVGRFSRLGVAASVQPSHLLSDAVAVRRAWGPRSEHAFPLADLEWAGATLAFGSDAPVEPPDPWRGIAAAVARRGPDWPSDEAFHPGQGLSLESAMRAACLGGPRTAGRRDEGHLGPGARADLMVLPSEPFATPGQAAALATLRPIATLLDGVVVHAAPDFDP
jgi:hypothetical protein